MICNEQLVMPVCIINVLLHYTYFSKTLVILHIGCFQNACQHSDKTCQREI